MPSTEGLIFLNENFGFGLISKIRLRSYSAPMTTLYYSIRSKGLLSSPISWNKVTNFLTTLYWPTTGHPILWLFLQNLSVERYGIFVLIWAWYSNTKRQKSEMCIQIYSDLTSQCFTMKNATFPFTIIHSFCNW